LQTIANRHQRIAFLHFVRSDSFTKHIFFQKKTGFHEQPIKKLYIFAAF